MCVIGTKVGQGHPDDCVCNDSVRPINLPNRPMNAVHKLICVSERDNRKLGQATFTDFHKVNVIFVGEDANSISKCTSLLVGFTFVFIAFEIWIILDPSSVI